MLRAGAQGSVAPRRGAVRGAPAAASRSLTFTVRFERSSCPPRARTLRSQHLRSARRWSRRATTHGLLVRRHGIFMRLRCAPHQRPTRERAANHGISPVIALARCSESAPAAHSPLSCARLIAAQRRRRDRQHQHHWRRFHRRLLRRRWLFHRRFGAPRAARAAAASRSSSLKLRFCDYVRFSGAGGRRLCSDCTRGSPARLPRVWQRGSTLPLVGSIFLCRAAAKKVLGVGPCFI